jgi:hypothetical protein
VISPDSQAKLYSAVGNVIVNWSLIEHTIDLFMRLVFHKLGGNALIKEIPKTIFKRKTDFLIKSFDTLPQLAEYKTNGLSSMLDIDKYIEDRHRIVHGVVIHFAEDVLHYTKIKYEKGKEDFDIYRYTLTDLLDYGKKIEDLAMNFGLMIRQIINEYAIQKYSQQ